MHVIPSVNASSSEEAEAQFKIISSFAHWVHLDIVDGKFAPNVTWGTPEEVLKIKNKNPNLKNAHLEIHLMVKNPESVTALWVGVADRIIVHVEALRDRQAFFKALGTKGVEAMLAIAPKTPSAKLLPHVSSFKLFQVLAVPPGKAGQAFDLDAVERIKFLRSNAPNAIIEVDGGMNPNTVHACREAGAHIFVAASYILKSNDPQAAYRELLKSAGH